MALHVHYESITMSRSVLLLSLVSMLGFSLVVSGCGLIEEVDGPKREDFALSPSGSQHDQTESPVTASEIQLGELVPSEMRALPAIDEQNDQALENDENVLGKALVVTR